MSRYIDADALIKEMQGRFIDNIEECIAIQIIGSAPSADVIPKDYHDKVCEVLCEKHRKEVEAIDHKCGEWKPKNHHTDYCSECGFEETQWRTVDYNFCPNCGADMRGADND